MSRDFYIFRKCSHPSVSEYCGIFKGTLPPSSTLSKGFQKQFSPLQYFSSLTPYRIVLTPRVTQDQSLEKFRDKCKANAEKERETLRKNIKGLAKTGIDIFARRIQGQWTEWYPFADERSMKAVEMLGLPGDVDGLVKTIDEHWNQIKKDDMLGEQIDEVKRNVFVMVLERSVAAELEGNVDQVRKAVA